MDGFATLLEYVLPTSSSDQTIAKVLGGWSDPSRAGSPPSLVCFQNHHHDAQARVHEYSAVIRQLYFSKIPKQGFADCLTATLLMYYDDTLELAPHHAVHEGMLAAAQEMASRPARQDELRDWGRFVRKHFVLENLLSLPVQFIKQNMSERELSEQNVGVHTFSEALERGVMGYREVVVELQDVKAMLHRVLDSMHELRVSAGRSSCSCQVHSQSCRSLDPTTVPTHTAQSHQPASRHTSPLALLGRPWPSDFTSVRSMHLQDLLVRYVREGLGFAAHDPGNRVQKEVQSAILMVSEFVELSSPPSGQKQTTEAHTIAHDQAVSAFARLVQRTVVAFVESKRARRDGAKRSRSLTGLVSGLVRAWGMLDPSSRASTTLLTKLRFEPPKET